MGFAIGNGFGTDPSENISILAAETDVSNDLYAGGSFVLYDGTSSAVSVERIARISSIGTIR